MTVSPLFNSTLELGVRCLVLLSESYPVGLHLDEILSLDYVMTHSGDFSGPASLHPTTTISIAEPFSRREITQRALRAFQIRGLVEETPDASKGLVWMAGDNAAPFVGYLSTPYHAALKERASWLWNQVKADGLERYYVAIEGKVVALRHGASL
jgi:hypothetical protein